MLTSLRNINMLRKVIPVPVHNPVTCLSIRSLKITCALKEANVRNPEAIFLKTNSEVPIIAVTDKDNVDIIGPPDPVSNLRPVIRKRLLHETALQRQLRDLQDKTQEWNQKFWLEHNKRFIKEKQDFINSHKTAENMTLTADEMSIFYKKFLDENQSTHFRYNFDWYKRNFELLFVALRVNVESIMRNS